MRAWCWFVLTLLGCTSPKQPAQPSPSEDLDARTMHLARRSLDDSNVAVIDGRIFDTFHKEPAVGATVVGTRTKLPSEEPAKSLADRIATPPEDDNVVCISDENGKFSLDVRPGTYMVTVYYNNTTTSVTHVEAAAGFGIRLDLTVDRDGNVPGAPLRITRP